MSIDNLASFFRDQGCLPHQVEFAVKFLAPDAPLKHLLLSVPGLGKGFAGSAIASYAATHGQQRSVLVLGPTALMAQWREMIERNTPDAHIVVADRRHFRELEANVEEGGPIWPPSSVVLMSTEFARQPDVAESLLQANWNLLIVDEAHRLTPGSQRYQVIATLIEQNPEMRVLFMRAKSQINQPWSKYLEDPLFQNIEISVWSRQNVRDHDGKPLLPEVRIEWVSYRRRDGEVQVLSQLQEALKATAGTDSRLQPQAAILMQTASSSLFALEQTLNRLLRTRNNFAHGRGDEDVSSDELDSESVVDKRALIQSPFFDKTGELLDLLDEVGTDSKFESLRTLLGQIGVLQNSDRRVCIFTSYLDTATYLESSLNEHCPQVLTLTGSLSFSDRERVVSDFAQKGGILIATSAVSTQIPEVAAVVFYDVPMNPETVDAQIGQFVRIGRSGSVLVFSFADESDILWIERLQKKFLETSHALGLEDFQSLGELDLQSILLPKET